MTARPSSWAAPLAPVARSSSGDQLLAPPSMPPPCTTFTFLPVTLLSTDCRWVMLDCCGPAPDCVRNSTTTSLEAFACRYAGANDPGGPLESNDGAATGWPPAHSCPAEQPVVVVPPPPPPAPPGAPTTVDEPSDPM